MLLDAINARLPDDKKMTITDLESDRQRRAPPRH
jgi:hypothetical protein